MDKLKKREQEYLIEQEQKRLHAFGRGLAFPLDDVKGAGGSFNNILRKYHLNFNDKGIRRIVNHLFEQLESLDVPLSDPGLTRLVEDYLEILQNNSQIDCSGYSYIPVGVLPQPNRLVIIGDLHADYCVTLDCLKLAGVISDSVTSSIPIDKIKCIAPAGTVVVQLGDQIDGDGRSGDIWDEVGRDCQSFIKIHRLFDHLNRAGTLVLAVYGNHELMNLDNDFKYIPGGHLSRQEAEEIRQYGIDQLRQDLVCTRRPFWVVGDWLLVHGGLTDDWFDLLGDDVMTNGNPELSSEIAGRVLQNQYLGAGDRNRVATRVLGAFETGDKHGPNPTWNRSYAKAGSCNKVPRSLRGVIKNIAISHTVQEGYEITNTHCGGINVYRLDTGMSAAFGRPGKAQIIIHELRGLPRIVS